MGLRKFKADRLFNGHRFIEGDPVLITDEEGGIKDILPAENAGEDILTLEGILSPGLINCHCHLELSHLKGVIPPHTGLISFLLDVVQKRGFEQEVIQENIQKAEQEMYENGIVAVGDICNQVDAIRVKQKSSIRWHSFIEVLSLTDERSSLNLENYNKVLRAHLEMLPPPNRSVLSPHAPYTVSKKSFELINDQTAHQTISIHNQEHPAEDELYKTGGGAFLKLLSLFGQQQSPFPITGKSSIRSVLPSFDNGQKIFLVHNTYMPEADLQFAIEFARESGQSLVICLCPNANRYIENRLPPVEQFMKYDLPIVLGTDSYSSNWQLSIAKEMQALLSIPFLKEKENALQTVLQWATFNGARALDWDADLGSFETGKKPGIVLIRHDLSSSKRIL